MFDFLKRSKKPEAKPVARKGFFSTDDVDSKVSRLELYGKIKEKTFQHTVADHLAVANGEAAIAMDDAGSNIKTLSNFMESIPDAQLNWYSSYGFIGYQVCAIISQHWLVNKACRIPAMDAVRNGYEITVNDGSDVDPEILARIRKLDKKFKIKHHMAEMVKFGRIFGIRVVLPIIESGDPQYYEKPFNPDGITKGSYKGMKQIDPYWMAPMLDGKSASDPTYQGFYEPTWWMINGKKYHKSHLIIMRNGGEVPDILKPTYLYGGIPLTQMIAERCYAAERTANEAPMLTMTKRTNAIYLDAEKAIANQAKFQQKMEIWASYRDNYGVKVLGESEKLEQLDTSLTDLDTVIMSQFQLVAAIAGTPATKLLETSPKGFNATGEYDEANYHEGLESIQEDYCDPLLDRHHLLIIRSDIIPQFGKVFEIEHNWKSTDAETAQELAETNLKKATTDKTLADAGAIDGHDIRRRLIADKESGYNGIEAEVPGMPDGEEDQDEGAEPDKDDEKDKE